MRQVGIENVTGPIDKEKPNDDHPLENHEE